MFPSVPDVASFNASMIEEFQSSQPTLSEILDPSDYTYANQYMSTAKLGMYLNGSWGFNDYLQDSGYPMQGYTDDTLSDALGFAQMPTQEKGGYVTMSGGWSWAAPNPG